MNNICLFCGGNANEPDHLSHCDGRQGRIEEEFTQGPPVVLDAKLGELLKRIGMARAEAGAGETFNDLALLAVHRAARRLRLINTDDVWVELRGLTPRGDRRSMGGVMRNGAAAGWIRKSDAPHQPSNRPAAHRNPKQPWESLVFRGRA